MRSGLTIGAEADLVWRVAAEHVIHLGYPPPSPADRLGAAEAGPPPQQSAGVFSTPNMILLMERAARKALEPYLEPGEESVGTAVDIEHLAATPLGAEVRGVARVTAIDRRTIAFEVSAYDRHEQIGRGTHRRAIVPLARIAERLAEKTGGQQPPGPLGQTHTPVSSPRAAPGNSPRNAPPAAAPAPSSLPATETLRVELDGPVATVTLDRPEKKNAVNVQMTDDWERLNQFLAQHPEIRIVLLTGAGGAFCAGDDVPEVGELTLEQAQELSYRQARVYLRWEQLPQVFLAAIDGVALGGGCVAACACDLRIASHAARIGMPEVLLGWPPGYGVAQLTALVGKSRAMEIMLGGESFTARQAHQYGLVHRLTASGTLLREARKWADELLALPAAALRETKQLVHADEGLQPKTAFLADTAAYIRCLAQPDAQEGIAAFREKRPPRFS